MGDPSDLKRALRRSMRTVAGAVTDRGTKSAAVGARLAALPAAAEASVVMVYEARQTEVDPAGFAAWCRERGIGVVAPAADRDAAHPVDPVTVDLVVVPGLAFTPSGDRLGQGGGWYDRFLERCSPSCAVVGICFDEQLVDAIPTEPHDIRMTHVITPARTFPEP